MDLPNNRFKLPFLVLCAAIFVVALAKGILVALFVPALASCLIAIGIVASGRNPRWMRSPLDRWEAKRLGNRPS